MFALSYLGASDEMTISVVGAVSFASLTILLRLLMVSVSLVKSFVPA